MAEKARCQSSVYLFSDYEKNVCQIMHKKEALRYEIEQDAAFMAVILFDSNKHLCMLIFNSQGNDINISALSQFFFQFEKTVVEVDPL